MQRTLAGLQKDCKLRGLPVPEGKHGRQVLLDRLAEHHLKLLPKVSWGLKKRLEIQSPMLCFHFKHLKPVEQEDVLRGPDWAFGKKHNGARLMIFYHPNEGFTFFSRNISVENYLPVEYTQNVLLIKEGSVTAPESWAGRFPKSFILDAECVVESKTIDTTFNTKGMGVVTGSELNACTAILALNPEGSKAIQMSQAPLKFEIFDVLEVGDHDAKPEAFSKRREALVRMMDVLSRHLPFHIENLVTANREEFYKDTVAASGEGVVAKYLKSPYVHTSSRGRKGFVKIKRSMKEALGEDFDVFITGFIPADEEKGWADCIGAIKVSVILRDGEKESDHWIASISGLPMELRKRMTVLSTSGQPMLNPEFLGKVITINGQSISSKSNRFSHAHVDNWDASWRPDKTRFDCVIDKDWLLSQVM